jgi:hypothetical protein
MSVMDAPNPWDECTNEPRGCTDEGREVHAYRLLVHDSWGNPLAAAQKSTALFSEKRPPWAHPFMKDADAGAITHGCVGVTGRPPS